MIDDRLSEELNALVDGELAEERAAELRARLDSDAGLRAEFDRLRRVADLLKTLPPARAHLVDDVMAKLPKRGRMVRPWGWLAGVAAAAAAVVLAVTLWETDPLPERGWTEAKGPAPIEAGKEAGSKLKKVGRGVPEDARESDGKLRRLESDEVGVVVPEGLRVEDRAGADSGLVEKATRDGSRETLEEADAAPESSRKEPRESVTTPPAPSKAIPPGDVAAAPDLLQRVEGKGAPLTEEERDSYLKRMRSLDDEALRKHMARVGAGRTLGPSTAKASSRSATKAKAADPGYSFEVVAADVTDAEAVREALAQAFRAEGGSAKRVAPSAFKAEARGATGGVLQYDWRATPQQAGTLAAWLERIGLLSAAPGGVQPGRLRITGEFAEEAKAKAEEKAAVRVRIRYRVPAPGDGRSDDR